MGVLGRQKYRQQSHLCQNLTHLRLRLLLASWKVMSPDADEIPAELIQAGEKHYILRYTILLSWFGTKKNCSTSGRNQLSYLFTKRMIKTECSDYRGISLVPTSYKILFNILLSRLIPYADEIIGDHQCGFRRNRSTTDQVYIRKILEKTWEYNGTVHQISRESIIQLGRKYYTVFSLSFQYPGK
jgi:hypothetical protein